MSEMSLGHRKLAAWYQQLAQALEAGLPLAAALRISHGTGAPGPALERMAATIEAGGSVADALRAAGAWLPHADLLALTAAAEAGRMPRTLHSLSQRHAQIGAARLRLVLACVYPLGVLHFALLLLPVVRMIDWENGFRWSATAYVRGAAVTLLPLWSAAGVIWFLALRRSPTLARVTELLPMVRSYTRTQALADFSFALGNLLEAGVPIAQAWATAGVITRSRELKTATEAVNATIARGEAPGSTVAALSCFPADFVALYRTGETTGQLDVTLLQLATQKQDAANRALSLATVVYPLFLFLFVAAGVVYFVITLYRDYLRMLSGFAG